MKIKKLYNLLKISFLNILFIVFLVECSFAIIIDRIIAYVDDYAITLSEFNQEFQKMKKNNVKITEQDAIDSIINRLLLIKEAKKTRLDANSEDELLNLYLDIKIRSRIFIKEETVLDFYKKNIDSFKGHDYQDIKEQIEIYLHEKEFNDNLKQHIEELRQKAEIKVFISDK